MLYHEERNKSRIAMGESMSEPVTFLSLGGGVQSTALLLKCLNGEYPMPDHVVFSDTGSEMPETYAVVKKLQDMCEGKVPFEWLKDGNKETWKLHEYYLSRGTLPVIGIRSCTSKFKIDPIKRFQRTIVGMGRGKILVESWLGISTDERRRATQPEAKWTRNKYPLLEMNMSRDACKRYNEEHFNMKVDKSGCFCCPYQHARQWTELNFKYPELFQISVAMEAEAKLKSAFRGGLYYSKESILQFQHSHTLLDFGMEIENKCDPSGGCFL